MESTGVYALYDRCKTLFLAPFNFSGSTAIEEEKLYEAFGPLYEVLNMDDSVEGFAKWVIIPLVVVFGDTILTDEGKALIINQQNKLNLLSNAYSSERASYLAKKEIVDLEDPWDFIKFANYDISIVGKAFLHALKYKKVKIV
jgi:hypothetical protein